MGFTLSVSTFEDSLEAGFLTFRSNFPGYKEAGGGGERKQSVILTVLTGNIHFFLCESIFTLIA